jgi:hypothetical protein
MRYEKAASSALKGYTEKQMKTSEAYSKLLTSLIDGKSVSICLRP